MELTRLSNEATTAKILDATIERTLDLTAIRDTKIVPKRSTRNEYSSNEASNLIFLPLLFSLLLILLNRSLF